MTGNFELDRMGVPVFYTPKGQINSHDGSFGKVFAESSAHDKSSWICVGYVSKQTPLGQGIFSGFPTKELRIATKEEVFAALKKDHKYGDHFRPSCIEVSDANFNLIMSKSVANWTNDGPSNVPPIRNISRKQIEDQGKQAAERHKKIMKNWIKICKNQIETIKKALNS